MAKCTIAECGRPARPSRKMCSMHEGRVYRTGNTQPDKPPRLINMPLKDRFLNFTPERPTDGCWPWHGYIRVDGYGEIGKGGAHSRILLAHRVSFQLTNGPIPPGTEIDHLCRNKACVNPAHLEAVPHRENVRRGGQSERMAALHDHSNGLRLCPICRRLKQFR